jgi:curved DNA-binding protein CbpA
MDYYELLQVSSSATFDEIHKAYRTLAMQYHPDRNPSREASSMMVSLNEAYGVLSEPARRRVYDQNRVKTFPFDITGSILRAAYEKMVKQGWIVTESDERHMILERGTRAVRVTFAARLDNAALKKIARQFAGFSVVLAVEIELPINLTFSTAVIDLLHSRYHGPAFPDQEYRALFAPFVSS